MLGLAPWESRGQQQEGKWQPTRANKEDLQKWQNFDSLWSLLYDFYKKLN